MKRVKPKVEIPGEPLPAHFHPKDTPMGMIARLNSSFGATADPYRGTVIITVGGGTIEATPEAAQRFADHLQCAINFAKKAAGVE